ncbi:MAG: biopolymer transporter ExbD [Planctomycetota bacterium]
MRRVQVPNSMNLPFNLTPMIDVIFLLIIFFLCVSQFQKAESDTTVELPTATSSATETPRPEKESRLIFNVLTDERILLAGRELKSSQISGILARRARELNPVPLEVWIRADRHVPYRVIEPLLVACARGGISNVAFKVINPLPQRGGNPE